MIDLHAHTTASDGKLSPTELINLAVNRGLEGIAITDHDNIDGLQEGIAYSIDKPLEFIPGIEFSTKHPSAKNEAHITGLFLNPNSTELIDLTERYIQAREEQKLKMIEKLNNLNYEISFDELKAVAGGRAYGRPHIAQILHNKYREEFPTMQSVFEKLIDKGGPAYVKKDKITIEETVKAIHAANGLAFIAHPGLLETDFEVTYGDFRKAGGDGIEVDYSYEAVYTKSKSNELRAYFRNFANENKLAISGGSDFHSLEWRVPTVGINGLSTKEFEDLKIYHENKFG